MDNAVNRYHVGFFIGSLEGLGYVAPSLWYCFLRESTSLNCRFRPNCVWAPEKKCWGNPLIY